MVLKKERRSPFIPGSLDAELETHLAGGEEETAECSEGATIIT